MESGKAAEAEDGDDQEMSEAQVQNLKSKKVKSLDQDTVDKAASLATESAYAEVLNRVPKTMAGFEKDFKQLQKEPSLFYKYLRNIPDKNVVQLFKKSEMETEVLSGILGAFSNHGLSDAASCKHVCQFLVALSKGSNFDMAFMMIDDAEKKLISNINTACKK